MAAPGNRHLTSRGRHRKPPALPPGQNGPCTGHRPPRSTG